MENVSELVYPDDIYSLDEAEAEGHDTGSAHNLKRFDNRAGFRLADVVEVALPVYSLSVSALTLANKHISPIEEFSLRCIGLNMTNQDELVSFLGLADEVIKPALASLAQSEQIALTALSGRNGWVLTSIGKKALEAAQLVVAEERTIALVFDALLQKATSLKVEGLLEFRQIAPEGRMEIQLRPSVRPTASAISPSDVERLFARSGSGENRKRHILGIRGIEPNVKKRFVPAIALLFKSLNNDDIQLGFVIGNQLSEEHATAFAGTPHFVEIVNRFRKDSPAQQAEIQQAIRDSGMDLDFIINVKATEATTTSLQVQVSEQTSRLRNAPDTEKEFLKGQLADAQARLKELELQHADVGFRNLYVVDHPPLLADAIQNAKQRILIISPWISSAVITYKFIKNLQATLRRGVKVYVGYGISGEEETRPIEENRGLAQLIDVAKHFPNLTIKRLGDTHAKILIKDSEFAATSSFNWLSFKGDPNRTFRDEQGILVSKPLEVDRKFNEVVERFQALR